MDNSQDWSNGPEFQQVSSQVNNKRSPLVPVLIGIVAVLVVVVIIGVFAILRSQNNEETLGEAQLGQGEITANKESKDNKVSLTTVTSTRSENQQRDVASAQGANGRTVADACQEIPLFRGRGVRIFAGEPNAEERGYDLLQQGVTATYVNYCDGKWAMWGQYGTDNGTGPCYWNGSEWECVDPDGDDEASGGAFKCWNKSKLESLGISQGLLNMKKFPLCEDNYSQSSSGSGSSAGSSGSNQVTGYDVPACDGRHILIVDSVIVQKGQNAQQIINQHLSNYARASFALPGACPSLRAVDPQTGGDIYPIYYDYGYDADRACGMWRSRGKIDNVRTLTNNQGVYTSPC